MYYYGARWYDSSLGRFSQSDSVSPRLSYKTEEENERIQVALTVDFSEPETSIKLGRFNWENSRDQSRYVGAKEKQNTQASKKTANANLLENDQSFETNKFFSDQILDSIRAAENLFRFEYRGQQDGKSQRKVGGGQDNSPVLPMHPLSPDRYAYARSCPTRFTDPSGHSECNVLGLTIGIAFIAIGGLVVVGAYMGVAGSLAMGQFELTGLIGVIGGTVGLLFIYGGAMAIKNSGCIDSLIKK
jgi:hypothetical protein